MELTIHKKKKNTSILITWKVQENLVKRYVSR